MQLSVQYILSNLYNRLPDFNRIIIYLLITNCPPIYCIVRDGNRMLKLVASETRNFNISSVMNWGSGGGLSRILQADFQLMDLAWIWKKKYSARSPS